jgi:hypothetical protein
MKIFIIMVLNIILLNANGGENSSVPGNLKGNIKQRQTLLRGYYNLHIDYCLESESIEANGKMAYAPPKSEVMRQIMVGHNMALFYSESGPLYETLKICTESISNVCSDHQKGKLPASYDGKRACEMAKHRKTYMKTLKSINGVLAPALDKL